MRRKRLVTAEELMAELTSDPEYVGDLARIQQKAAGRNSMLEAELLPVVDSVNRLGYSVPTLKDLLDRFAPLPSDVVQELLHWLARVKSVPAKEMVARTIGAASAPYPGSPLVECFETTRDESLKFAIANTLFMSRPLGIDEWLINSVESSIADGTRGILALALAKHVSAARALPPLHRIFDELPGQVAKAFGEIGGMAELEELNRRFHSSTGWPKSEISRAIHKIEKRLS